MGQDMKRWMTNVMAIVAIVAFAAGCDDTPTGGDGAIAFTVTPASATIARGASEIFEGTVTRSGGFSGAVTVAVTGAPSGVTAVVSNAVTTGLVTTADITIQVAATTAPGVYNLTARAQGSLGYRGALTGGNTQTDRAIIRRDQNIPNNGTLAQLDFNGTESFPAASATITVGGAAGGETVMAAVSYQTGASCSLASLYFLQNVGSSFAGTGIPAAQQRATDFHNVSLQAITGSTAFRSVSESFHTFAARTVSLPAALPTPSITQLSGPYKRLQSVYTLPSGYNSTTFFGYDDGTRSVNIIASFAYLGGTSVTLANA